MLRRFTIPAIAAVAAVSLVVSPAVAAQTDEEIDQTVATYDQLVEIVNREVVSAYAGVKATVNDLVAGTVNSAIGNPQAVIALATPLIKAAVKGAIGQYIQDDRIDSIIDGAVDAIADSELIAAVVDNEFIQAVLQRTVRYAVADIIDSLGLDADQQATADMLVTRVWNAPRVTVGTAPTKVKSDLGSPAYGMGIGLNTSYYSYNVTAWNQRRVIVMINDTPKEIQVTGWNAGNINLLASGVAVVSAGSKADSIIATLASLDYVSILMDAGSRALRDEITERVQAALLTLKTKLLEYITEGLASIDVPVTLNPADSWITIGQQIVTALNQVAQDRLNAALAALPPLSVPLGEPGDSYLSIAMGIWNYGASYLWGLLHNINWLDLIRGRSGATPAKPAGPSLTVSFDRKAMTNTDVPALTLVAKDDAGVVMPGAQLAAQYSYSYGDSCQFANGQAPSRRTCTVTATYNGLTAKASVEVFDPSALAAPIDGDAIPGATVKATAPQGWPTVTRAWTRNGTRFSTAASYRLPTTEKLGNVIGLKQTMTYQGLTIEGSAPDLTVATGTAASLTIKPKVEAITNAGGVELTAVAKDALKNTIPAGATDTTYTYSLGDGCSFPTGEAPARRTCTITGTFQGVSATTTVDVFDPSALAAPIAGEAAPGATLKAQPPAGWPTITRRWTRNGTLFSTATSYKLPSTEKVGNSIALTQTMTYRGLTISGTSPALTVALGAPASLTITPKAKAIDNSGGVVLTAVAKDAYGNKIPAAETGTVYTYSEQDGCAFTTGEAPSRRTCTITGTFGGVSGTASVEVFDPSALGAPIDGVATPGSTLKAQPPAGWPTITRRWTRNGTLFSTAASYKLPSTEKAGNVIELTQKMTYQGLTISASSPALTVVR
ncbi:MAG: hypothetical protein LBH48_06550 [Bifidobacteriaceae bacterium]|jgi:hypothetical protein|nr:hypothetical protein [Bifidobacteriaceae bacterium]